MESYTYDQKLAMLVVPVLLFGVLGAATAAAQGRNFSELTEAQKEAIEEAHVLRESGEFERARNVLEAAGLMRGPSLMPEPEKRSAIRAAIEANDYDAFIKAAEGTPFADTMTRNAFSVMVEAHQLRESGDFLGVGARAHIEETGILPFRHGLSHHHHHGYGFWQEPPL
jgi:hypothetical protein